MTMKGDRTSRANGETVGNDLATLRHREAGRRIPSATESCHRSWPRATTTESESPPTALDSLLSPAPTPFKADLEQVAGVLEVSVTRGHVKTLRSTRGWDQVNIRVPGRASPGKSPNSRSAWTQGPVPEHPPNQQLVPK